MKFIKVKDFDYNIASDGGNVLGYIRVYKNLLLTNLPDRILIDIVYKFIDKINKENISKSYLIYRGDSAFIKNQFYYNSCRDMCLIYLSSYKYSIKSEFIEPKFIKKIFKKRGNWEEQDPLNSKEHLQLFVKEGITYTKDKRLWNTKSIIGNNLNPNSTPVSSKNSHRQLIPKSLHSFLPDQISFKLTLDFDTDKYKKYFDKYPVLILKPVDGWGGHGITIHDSFHSFSKRIDQLKQIKGRDNWSEKRNKNYDFSNYLNWVLDEYVIDPLLYEGRKFHVRVYFIYHQYLNSKKAYIYEKIRLAIADDPYVPSQFNNTKIHDTHYAVKDVMELVYLDQILKPKKYADIVEQIKMLFTAIAENMETECYHENQICYQVYAADVMINSDYTIKLLEVNSQPGFNLKLNTSGIILENVMYHIVDKILPPKNEIEEPEEKFITLLDIKYPQYDMTRDVKTSRGSLDNPITFIDAVANAWFTEGYGPVPKKDRTGGYYLKCSEDEQTLHIHIVGAGGKFHPNSWSRKGEERRKWEYLNWWMTPKEQAYYMYFKSGYYKEATCVRYRKSRCV
jgi:hypothetical protein